MPKRRAGFLDALIGQLLAGREHAGQDGQHGIAQLAAILVGDFRLGFVTAPRRQIARGAMHEHAHRAAGVALHHFAHGADIIGRQQPVAAAQRDGMAGIVDDGGADPAVHAGNAADQQRVVGLFGQVQAANVAAAWPDPPHRG